MDDDRHQALWAEIEDLKLQRQDLRDLKRIREAEVSKWEEDARAAKEDAESARAEVTRLNTLLAVAKPTANPVGGIEREGEDGMMLDQTRVPTDSDTRTSWEGEARRLKDDLAAMKQQKERAEVETARVPGLLQAASRWEAEARRLAEVARVAKEETTRSNEGAKRVCADYQKIGQQLQVTYARVHRDAARITALSGALKAKEDEKAQLMAAVRAALEAKRKADEQVAQMSLRLNDVNQLQAENSRLKKEKSALHSRMRDVRKPGGWRGGAGYREGAHGPMREIEDLKAQLGMARTEIRKLKEAEGTGDRGRQILPYHEASVRK